MPEIEFKENQRFKELSVFILVGLLQLLFLWGLIQQVFLNKPWGTKPAGDLTLIIINLGNVLLIALLFSFNLKTKINEESIRFKFSPLHIRTRSISWKQVKSVRMIKYDGIKEYWGYGLRYMPGKGWCYTMPGEYAILLFLKNGKKTLIGTHKTSEITQILRFLKSKEIVEFPD